MSWGLVPVRLCDVPENIRYAAARREIRKAPDEAESLFLAAVRPSNRTYWLPETKRVMVETLTRRAA